MSWTSLANGRENRKLVWRYEKARVIGEGVLESETDFAGAHVVAHMQLAATDIFDGDVSSAQHHAKRAIEILPQVSVSGTKSFLSYWKDKEFLERYVSALREAGIPENPPGQ